MSNSTHSVVAAWLFAGAIAMPLSASAFQQSSYSINAGGGWSSNATFASISTIGQECPVEVSSNAAFINQGGFIPTLVNIPFADANGNGLPDAWEIAYFGSTNAINGGGTNDPDGDGQSNLEEYFAGTDPTNGADAFAVVDDTIPLTNNFFRVLWASVAGRVYDVQKASAFTAGVWSNLAIVAATPPVNAYYDTNIVDDSAFYRVILDSSINGGPTQATVNAYGYSRVAIQTGTWEMCGMNLDLAGRTVDSVFKGQLPGGANPYTASSVLKWDGAGQRYQEHWMFDSHTGNPLDGTMINRDLAVPSTNETLRCGEGFWIANRSTNAIKVWFAGYVPNQGAVTNTIHQGFNMFAYPYPVDKPLSNMTFFASGAHGTRNPFTADQINYWDSALGAYRTAWLFDGGTNNTMSGTWIDRDTVTPSSALFRLGYGAWYNSKPTNSFDWIEQRPYPSVRQLP